MADVVSSESPAQEVSANALTKPKKHKTSGGVPSVVNTLALESTPQQVSAQKVSTKEALSLESAPKDVSTNKGSGDDVSTTKASTHVRTKPRKRKSSEASLGKHSFLLRTVKMVRPSRWVEFECERLPNFEALVGSEVRFAGYISEGGRYEGVCYLKHPTKCVRDNSAKKLVTLLGLGSKGKVVSLPGHPKMFSRVYSKKLVRVGDEPAQGSRSDLVDNHGTEEIVKRLHARLTQLGNRISRQTSDPRTAPALIVLHEVISSMVGRQPTTSTTTLPT